jgi:hypothetical protein
MSEITGEVNWDEWKHKVDWVSDKWNNGIPANGDVPENLTPSVQDIAFYAQKVFCNPDININIIAGIKSEFPGKFNSRPDAPPRPKPLPINDCHFVSTP